MQIINRQRIKYWALIIILATFNLSISAQIQLYNASNSSVGILKGQLLSQSKKYFQPKQQVIIENADTNSNYFFIEIIDPISSFTAQPFLIKNGNNYSISSFTQYKKTFYTLYERKPNSFDSINNFFTNQFYKLNGSIYILKHPQLTNNKLSLKQRDSIINQLYTNGVSTLLTIRNRLYKQASKTEVDTVYSSWQQLLYTQYIRNKLWLTSYRKEQNIANYYKDSLLLFLQNEIYKQPINAYNTFELLDTIFERTKLVNKKLNQTNHLPTPIKNYLRFKQIMHKCLYAKCDSLALLQFLSDTSVNGVLKQVLQRKFLTDYTSSRTQLQLQTPQLKNVSWQSILHEHRGQILYVDFWATWCKPCLAQKPFLQTLQNKFKNDSITFVYISIDEDVTKWTNFIKKEPYNKNVLHLHLTDTKNKRFDSNISIAEIPQFAIYNKNGLILNENALRPSSLNLVVQLKQMLTWQKSTQ